MESDEDTFLFTVILALFGGGLLAALLLGLFNLSQLSSQSAGPR